MTFKELNRFIALRQPVKYRSELRIPTAIIKRYDRKAARFFYQVELADAAACHSVTIVPLSDVVDER